MGNKKGSTLVTVIVSFALLLIVIGIFDKMISMAGNMSAVAASKSQAYEAAYDKVFTTDVYRPTAELDFTFDSGTDTGFKGQYTSDAGSSFTGIAGSTATVNCYFQWVQAEGDGITARVYMFSPNVQLSQ